MTFYSKELLYGLFLHSSDKPKEEREHKKKSEEKTHSSAPTAKQTKGLSESQRDRFEDMLRSLLPERNPIAETMVLNAFTAKKFQIKFLLLFFP